MNNNIYSRSFLHSFPVDKENNPNNGNKVCNKKLQSKLPMEITEKMSKFPPVLAVAQENNENIGYENKQTLPEKVEKQEKLSNADIPSKQRKLSTEKKASPKCFTYSEKENFRLNEVYSKEITDYLIKNEVILLSSNNLIFS